MAGQHLAMTIYQYDIEGNFIKEWDSQIDITVYFDLNTKISRVVDSNKPYRNCFWSTIYYMKHPISKIINDKDLYYNIIKKQHLSKVKIKQYTKDGTFIKEYNGIAETAKLLNLTKNSLKNCLVGRRKTYKGFVWKYSNDDFEKVEYKKPITHNRCSPILQYNIEGNFIREWKSIKQAKIETGLKTIGDYLLGRTKSCGGYIWKYKN